MSGNMGLGEQIAAAGGVILVIAMLALGWYTVNEITVEDPASGQEVTISPEDVSAPGEEVDDSTSAFQAFSFIDILLLLAAVVAVVGVVLRATGNPAGDGMGPVIMGAGAVAFVLVLFRLIITPDFTGNLGDEGLPDGIEADVDASRGIGLFIGLIASAAIAYGGMLISGNRPGSAGPQV